MLHYRGSLLECYTVVVHYQNATLLWFITRMLHCCGSKTKCYTVMVQKQNATLLWFVNKYSFLKCQCVVRVHVLTRKMQLELKVNYPFFGRLTEQTHCMFKVHSSGVKTELNNIWSSFKHFQSPCTKNRQFLFAWLDFRVITVQRHCSIGWISLKVLGSI